MGLVDPALANLLIVHVKGAGAAFADAAAVVVELELDGRFAGGKRILRLDCVAVSTQPVVTVLEFSAFHVERPAAETSALRNDHALATALRDFDVGGDGMRAVL